jgi:hypothetical protein
MCIETKTQICIRIQLYIDKLCNGMERTKQHRDVELVMDRSWMKYISHVVDALRV